MSLPSMVVLDLDGTVVPYSYHDAPPSERVVKAVGRVLEAGVPVVVATGRAVWSALPTIRRLGLHGIELVTSNGAVVYDADSDTVLYAETVDVAPAAAALTAARDGLEFAVERGVEGFFVTPGFGAEFDHELVGRGTLAELVAAPTTRMVCRLPAARQTPEIWSWQSQEALALATSVLDPREYSIETGYSGWIDIAAPGVTKGTGAQRLAERLGVDPAGALAIGDGTNDLALFAWAGRSVAMGQANDRVKRAAGEVTATIDEDGVALVLESLVD